MEPFSTTTLFRDEQILVDRWWWDEERFSDLVFALTKCAVIPKTDPNSFVCKKIPRNLFIPQKRAIS